MLTVTFQTILVAIDTSAVSEKAFATATQLAKALGAKLLLLHVLSDNDADSPKPLYSYSPTYGVDIDSFVKERYEHEWAEYLQRHESLLKEKTSAAIAAGINADFIQPSGRIGATICNIAQLHHADLIVVGSHQRRGMRELLSGSTSNYITHHAPCSVMVVTLDPLSVHDGAQQPLEDAALLSA